MIVLSRDGKAVTRIGTSFEVKCTSGKFLASLLDAQAKLPLGATGSFSSKQTATGDLGNGATARRTVTLKGVVKGRQLTGSAHVHHDVLDAAGAVTDTCDETSTFKATSSAGKVFGGTTSQHGPVVIELTADGKKVHHFHIGWQSTCTPSGFFQVGGTLLNFRIQNGSFGADFSQDFPEPTGEKETDSYSVSGKIKRAKATGTFRVKTTDADPTGATTSSCDTGPITYKTSSG